MRMNVREIMSEKARKVSNVLLDFVFGEPIPQPEVVTQDTEQAWQAWLDAMTAQENEKEDKNGFARTVPMLMQ
jgi:hypothetical protein